MRIYLFVILMYGACIASKRDVTLRSHVRGNQMINDGRIFVIRTSQSGQQKFYKGCGIPRMLQYPKTCTVGRDVRHCEIQSAFYHPVSQSGRNMRIPVVPCGSDQTPLLTIADFAVFDKDGSGFVDTRELITASRVAEEADALFSTSDLNKDGFMDMCEFSKFPRSWKQILDKIRYFYSHFKIPGNTFICIEFDSSYSAVERAWNITDTIFVGEMGVTPTTINILKEVQTFNTNSLMKPSTARLPRDQMGDHLITEVSERVTKMLFADTISTKGMSELHEIPLTTIASIVTRTSSPVSETGSFLTRLGLHITTAYALGGARNSSTLANDGTGDSNLENRSNVITPETIYKPSDWRIDNRQRLSTKPTVTSEATKTINVSPAFQLNFINDTKENAKTTYLNKFGTPKAELNGGIYTIMNKMSTSFSNGVQTWSMELPMTPTVSPETETKPAPKISSQENKTNTTDMSDSENTTRFTLYTNQREKYFQDAKTQHQGTTVAQPTELFANGIPEKKLRRNQIMNMFRHITDLMTNASTTVGYDNITEYKVGSTIELTKQNATEKPNKEEVANTIKQHNMIPEDNTSAITIFPVQLATEEILGHKQHQDDTNMETLDTYAQQPSTYESVYAERDLGTSSLVGAQADLPYKGMENITKEQMNISEAVYDRMKNEEVERQDLHADHTRELWTVSTTRKVHKSQLDVIKRERVYETNVLDQYSSGKNETKMPFLETDPRYLDRDSFYTQRRMMNRMKAIRANKSQWYQRHDRPAFQYANRPWFMTYQRPHLTSFPRDINKGIFSPENQNKQVSIIPAMKRYRPEVGVNHPTNGTYDNLGILKSTVDKINQHLIYQSRSQGNKDHPHAFNEIKNKNSLANLFLSKTIEQDRNSFPRPKKDKVQEDGIYTGIGSSFSEKYTSGTFPNITWAPKEKPYKTKDVSGNARSKINIETQHKISQQTKGHRKMVTFQPKSKWTKSFDLNKKDTKEIYVLKNGENSAEESIYPDVDVDSDERSD